MRIRPSLCATLVLLAGCFNPEDPAPADTDDLSEIERAKLLEVLRRDAISLLVSSPADLDTAFAVVDAQSVDTEHRCEGGDG